MSSTTSFHLASLVRERNAADPDREVCPECRGAGVIHDDLYGFSRGVTCCACDGEGSWECEPLCDGCDRPLTNGYCVDCDHPAHTAYRLGLVRQALADTNPLTKLRNMGEAA